MQDISTFATARTDPVFVAWLDQFGQQVTFIAALANDSHWYANGSRIGRPTHWKELPRIGAAKESATFGSLRDAAKPVPQGASSATTVS